MLDMGHPMYVCTTCSEHFTRKYSAKRHNITVYGNRGKIVPLIEFLVGRNSGRYQASHPFWHPRARNEKHIHNFGRAMIADSGEAFRPRSEERQQQGQYQHHQQSSEQQERYHGQHQELKIEELKRLVYRYSQYHRNPGAVINCIIYYSNNGDNTLLDAKVFHNPISNRKMKD